MIDNSIRREIIRLFRKHCSKCKGICCSGEINAFIFEINKWPKKKLILKKNWLKRHMSKYPMRRFNVGKKCPYVERNSCIIKPEARPIDCLSYPVYPIIKIAKNKTDLTGLMIHKSCPFAKEISRDKDLINLLKKFWEFLLRKINGKNVKTWLGNKRNYWLDKNIIKIKI